MAFSKKYLGSALAILGIIIAVAGIIGFFIIGHAIDVGLRDAKVLTNSSSAFQTWSSNVPSQDSADPNNKNIVPINMTFTLYNLTNADEVLKGAKPEYKEIGPYVYKEYQLRFDSNFTDDGNLVSFYESRYYVFDRESTYAHLNPETDLITAVNPIYMGVLNNAGGSESGLIKAMVGPGIQQLFEQFDQLVPMASIFMYRYTFAYSAFNTFKSQFPNNYLDIWVNATSPPTSDWVNYTISAGATDSSGISQASAESILHDFTTLDPAWIDVLTNATKRGELAKKYNLSSRQAAMLFAWVAKYVQNVVIPKIEILKGVPVSELGWRQWASGDALPFPITVQVLASQIGITLPGPPEFFFFDPKSRMSMTVDQAKSLFDPKHTKYSLFDSSNIQTFVGLVSAGNWVQIEANWNVTQAIAVRMVAYFSYFREKFISAIGVPQVQDAIKNGGGLISTRTVDEWLWSYTDPLLVVLNQTVTNGALFVNDTSLDFVRQTTKRNIQFTGLNDTSLAQSFLAWNGSTEVLNIWNGTVVVNGTEGNNFPPDLDTSVPVTVFDSTTLRPAVFDANETVTIKGIELLRYRLSQEMFNSSSVFYQTLYGFANMSSAYNKAPIFLSKPHFFQTTGGWLDKINIINYIGPPDLAHDDIILDVEPISGITMNEVKQLQVNVFLSGNPATVFDSFGHYQNVTTDIMHPVFVASELQQISDYLANQFVSQVYTGEMVKKVVLWALLGTGMLLLLSGCLMVIFGSKAEYEAIT